MRRRVSLWNSWSSQLQRLEFTALAVRARKMQSEFRTAKAVNSNFCSWLAASLLLLAANLTAATPEHEIRIMPMGDSITTGYTDNARWSVPFKFGYRSGLFTRLTKAGCTFRFVGGCTEPWTGISGDPSHGGSYKPELDLRDLEQDGHRGYGGKTAGFLNAHIHAWLASDNPDIILLKIGTNHQDHKGLDALVNSIVTSKPNTHLIIAQIMPKIHYQQGIVDYNRYIRETLVPSYQAKGKNVSIVDQYANFLTDPDDLSTIDKSLISNGINHPDNVGYDKMAQTWFEAIQTLDLSKPTAPAKPASVTDNGRISSSTELAYAAAASDTDLLHGLTAYTSGWNMSGGASPQRLHDGTHGAAYNVVPREPVQGAWTTVGATAEYEFGKAFDITRIQSIAAWNSAGFGNQAWTVEVKLNGADSYTTLATVDHQPLGAGAGATNVTLTDPSGILASGVTAIRVIANAANSGANAGAFVWREFDVFGVETSK